MIDKIEVINKMNHMNFDEWIRANYPDYEIDYSEDDCWCPLCEDCDDYCPDCDWTGSYYAYERKQEYRECLLKDRGVLAMADKGFGDLPLFR